MSAALMSKAWGGRRSIPWIPVLAAFVVAGIALVGIEAPRHTRPLPVPASTVVAARDLRFEDHADGSIAVLDAASGLRAGTVEPLTGGFVRGVMHGLARTRQRRGVGPLVPFRLVASSDGRLVIGDPATGAMVELEGFGMTNATSFAQFLPTRVLPTREPAP